MMKRRVLLCPLLGVVLIFCTCDAENSSCSNGEIELNGTADWYGAVMMCEESVWRRMVVCNISLEPQSSAPQWSENNTEVVCRELGFLSVTVASYNTEEYDNEEVRYIPQCVGNEERLINCSTTPQPPNCNYVMMISITCVPNSTPPSSTIDTTSFSQSAIVSVVSLSTSQPDGLLTSVTHSSSTILSSSLPSPLPSHPPPSPSLPVALISLGTSLGLVAILLLVPIAVVLICCRPHRVKPLHDPYEVPVTTLERTNQTFDLVTTNIPNTEVLYDRATTPPSSHHYHTLTHSPTTTISHPSTSASASQSTAASSTDGYAIVGPAEAMSGGARDPPKGIAPVYYHVLRNPKETRKETELGDTKYHVLESPGPLYHTLEQSTIGEPGGAITGRGGGGAVRGGPVYSEVVTERKTVTLKPTTTAHSDLNFTVSLPKNLSGSATLL